MAVSQISIVSVSLAFSLITCKVRLDVLRQVFDRNCLDVSAQVSAKPFVLLPLAVMVNVSMVNVSMVNVSESGPSVRCRVFENIYIGWGHKYTSDGYSPPPMPSILDEYPSGPEITEAEDPTPQQEAELRAAMEEANEEEEEEGDDEDED